MRRIAQRRGEWVFYDLCTGKLKKETLVTEEISDINGRVKRELGSCDVIHVKHNSSATRPHL